MDLSSYYQSVFYQSRDSDPYPLYSSGYTHCQDIHQYNDLYHGSQVLNSSSDDSVVLSPPSNNGRVPRIPPLAVLQQRRLAANARERKRANKINFAFNRLRKVLPGFQDKEISKFEAIILAQDYIKQLVEILNNEEDKENKQFNATPSEKLGWNMAQKKAVKIDNRHGN